MFPAAPDIIETSNSSIVKSFAEDVAAAYADNYTSFSTTAVNRKRVESVQIAKILMITTPTGDPAKHRICTKWAMARSRTGYFVRTMH